VVSGRPAFLLRDCIAWRVDREKDLAANNESPIEANERARKLRAEADLKELELRQKRGELVELAAFEEAIDRIIGGFAAVAAGRLARFEREMVKCTTAGGARKIRERIAAALMEGARGYADEWEAEAEAVEAVAA
jgi:phage terminase Nu1 subunit (DNA packaging protein)